MPNTSRNKKIPKNNFAAVPDTNIVISAQLGNPKSPNKEYFQRWYNTEFVLLYSQDTLLEYIVKLKALGVPSDKICKLVIAILKNGVHTEIKYYHLPVYPRDRDDTAFVLCAENGNATHLISYDSHLLDLRYRYRFDFKICKMIPFLQELRKKQPHVH